MKPGPQRKEVDVARLPKAPATPLPQRIARARAEGRTQQALELTRQLHKQEPSPLHDELLRQVLLERGNQLAQQGHTRDAAVVFTNALSLNGAPEFRAKMAERLAECGDAAHALAALGPDANPPLRQRILGHVADLAVRQGSAGKRALPAELHAGFDAVLQAFAHGEAGRDEDVRAALQAIGLTSPFLEWKLFIRGLLAYQAGDDARALENWQRLDPQRAPARLAAPLRYGIDRAFRGAQAAAAQKSLQQQAARLLGSGGTTPLETLRKGLADPRSLANVFRTAEPIVSEWRRDRPQLVPRLAHCLFWAIVDHGQPEDVDRYYRVFGPAIASDFEIGRLGALALEHRGMLQEAHTAWQTVLKTVARAPKDWPGEAGKRVQALIWLHMGENAATQDREASKELPLLFRPFFEKPQPLKPGAAQCFEHSIELSPDRVDGYLALFHLHREAGNTAKARKVGEQLLKRFPEHAETSEALGDLFLQTQEPAKARDCYEKALAANPLERRLRGKVVQARQNVGLEQTLVGKFEAARAAYRSALALNDGPAGPIQCQWAVLEMKAGEDERAAELTAQAAAGTGQRVAVRYTLVGESVRAKLSLTQRKQLAGELTAALAETPTPAEVLALLQAAAGQRQRQLDPFRGQKTHEKTFLRFLDQIPISEFSETELEQLCSYLQALDARRPWQRYRSVAEDRFPDNPVFILSELDFLLSRREPDSRPWQLSDTLDHARELVHQLPREAQERFLPILRERQKQIEAIVGSRVDPMELMGGMLDAFDEPDFDDD
jgi:tetratricopeptide (TPR) repeat protein